jgi:polysaccharide export outer membrane protein
MRAIRFAFVLLVAAGCVSAPPMPSQSPERLLEYRVAPPDVLRITVRPDPAIERELTIRPDGRISLDLIGDVVVEGKSVDEIRGEILARIKEYIVSPEVSVVLATSASRRYYVFGEVLRPGAYPLIGRVTAIDALASAAGETRFSALNSSRLVRVSPEASQIFPVRLRDIRESGDASTNYELRPGDVIFVPPSTPARIGYAISMVFLPLQAILGLAQPVTSVYVPSQ